MARPMAPKEFAEAVLAPGLTWDQIQEIVSADVAADLAAIQARHTHENEHDQDDAVVLALPAPTGDTHENEEVAA